MSARFQRGYVYRKGSAWFVRYSDHGKQRAFRLASLELCKTKSAARLLAEQHLAPLNEGRGSSTITLEHFVARVYLPAVAAQKRVSTYRGYRNLWLKYLSGQLPVLSCQLDQIRTADIDRVLAEIAEGHHLNVTSLRHVKAFLSGIFRYAKRQGILNSENPVHDAAIPKAPPARETHAYSLDEIGRILDALSEPAATIAAVAAFTGLRKGEIRGLQWGDYDGEQITVARAYWRGHVDEPKTKKSKAPVPVIAQLRARLDRLRTSCQSRPIEDAAKGCNTCSPLMFPASRDTAKPVNLEALARRATRELRSAGIEWHGWHAFRRGLATNLYHLGVPDKVIQRILRHSTVSVTQACYIKEVDADVQAAMRRLGEVSPN